VDGNLSKCREIVWIDLGSATGQAQLCRMDCVKSFKSKAGYEFGLHINAPTVKDAPHCLSTAENHVPATVR
jgi:hypothetical protein